jgi:hypothetical protein
MGSLLIREGERASQMLFAAETGNQTDVLVLYQKEVEDS